MTKRRTITLGAVAGTAAVGAGAAWAVARARRAARVRRLRAAPGKNVVILGGGFGGVNTAHWLLPQLPPESGWTVTLVDAHNYFCFTPLLYHAATGLVDPSNILFPLRTLFHAPNFKFREAMVQGLDLRDRRVLLDDGELPYDYLVLALGSVPNYFGKEDEVRAALRLHGVADAVRIRNRIIDAFERADVATDAEERRRCLTFVIVGGGATGIELAGAIRGLTRDVLMRQYRDLRGEEVRVVVCEAATEILPGLSRSLAAFALQRLRDLGVEVRLETPVEQVDAEGVTLKGGERLPSRTVVWAAGVRPSPLAERFGLPAAKNGRLLVDPYLQVQGHPGVYALGDLAAFEDAVTGKPLPPMAAVVVQEAAALARILASRIAGGDSEPFAYHERGELVSLGRHEAVAEVFGRQFTGFPAWLIWRAFYLSQLMGFKNRLGVALDWTFAYAYQREIVQLEYPEPEEEPETAKAARRWELKA